MLHLLLATRNAHKTEEFAAILGPGFAVSDLRSVNNFGEVEETGKTFEDNARLKALAASLITSDFVVADDSGLELAALGGAPGVYSARYGGEHASDAENIAKLLTELEKVNSGRANRAAQFRCAIALARAGAIVDVFVGTVHGVIADVPRGENGFGYDPVFVPNGYDKTFAELGMTRKNRISHRAAAIEELRVGLARVAAEPA